MQRHQQNNASKLKSTLQNSYEITVRTKMKAELKREMEFYDEKVHGKPFEVDDLVWLHSPVVGGKGKSKKFHCPWQGPYRLHLQNQAVSEGQEDSCTL